ncbi:helix-turn-helix transcriptional regulator [Streptomyces sp. NPDC051776]|uniref:helix-turn-helix domain-containing protein n=1 Tax=Streptomyces sp. NPDC051776 TaxID=3155414 RepID=UPI00342AB1B0
MPTMSTEDLLRLTITALMARTGEQQRDLAEGIGLSPTQVSRKQSAQRSWSLDDCDRLAAHYGMPVLDLLAGPTHAAHKLPEDRVAAALASPFRLG